MAEPAPQREEPAGEVFHLATIIIKPFRLETVLNALRPFHISGLTVTEVRGYGRQKGHLELYRGAEYVISFIPKLKLEFVVSAGEAPEVIEAVQQAARTGRIGDGKIFLTPVVDLIDDAV